MNKLLKAPSSKLQANKGFTLLEVLLSISIVAILSGLSVPVWRNLQIKNDLDVVTTTIVQNLRRAQILSQAVDGDSTWGLKVQSGSIVLFKGASYAVRDSTFDETSDLQTSITPTGVTEIVFAKLTGLPQTTGTVTLTSEQDSKNITINTKGMVDY